MARTNEKRTTIHEWDDVNVKVNYFWAADDKMIRWVGGNFMDFFIADSFSNGSGQQFSSKTEFLEELSRMIDDCEANGGVFFDVLINTNASCFSTEA